MIFGTTNAVHKNRDVIHFYKQVSTSKVNTLILQVSDY